MTSPAAASITERFCTAFAVVCFLAACTSAQMPHSTAQKPAAIDPEPSQNSSDITTGVSQAPLRSPPASDVTVNVLLTSDTQRHLILGASTLLATEPDRAEVLMGNLTLPADAGTVIALTEDSVYECRSVVPRDKPDMSRIVHGLWSRRDRATLHIRWTVELPGQCARGILAKDHLVVERHAPDGLTWLSVDDGTVSLDIAGQQALTIASLDDQLCSTDNHSLTCWRGTTQAFRQPLQRAVDAMAITTAGVVLSTGTALITTDTDLMPLVTRSSLEVGALCFDGKLLLVLDASGLHACDARAERCWLLVDSVTHELVSSPGLSMRCSPGHAVFEHNPRLHVWETVWVHYGESTKTGASLNQPGKRQE